MLVGVHASTWLAEIDVGVNSCHSQVIGRYAFRLDLVEQSLTSRVITIDPYICSYQQMSLMFNSYRL